MDPPIDETGYKGSKLPHEDFRKWFDMQGWPETWANPMLQCWQEAQRQYYKETYETPEIHLDVTTEG